MAKLSKPMQWIVILALAGGVAAYFFTEPEGGRKNRKSIATATRSTAPEGFKPEDMTAQFPRLAGLPRNVFTPKVMVKKSLLSPGAADLGKLTAAPAKPTWALTGIFIQNGVRMALLENAATGESQTVKSGQSWMGQAVLAIKPEGVLFSNGTQMVFAEPPEESVATSAIAATAAISPVLLPGAPTVPSGVTVPTPPLTIPPPEQAPNPGRGRRRRASQGGTSETNSLRLNQPLDAAPTQSTAPTQPTGSRP